MAKRLPITVAPGTATTAPVRRQSENTYLRDLDSPVHQGWATKRLHGCLENPVFVGHSERPVQDEALMGPEISWCEWHCRGQWDVCYGHDVPGAGRETFFSFSDPEDATAFRRWREQRRDDHARPEDFE